MPTTHPRHSITETPALAAVLQPLRDRLGDETPTLAELVQRGAEAALAEVNAQDASQTRARQTFMERMMAGPEPDLGEFERIRRHSREP